ncbi:MAG: hypothetical protein M5R36_22585 [Deltaproteobacteria bacterium]|nr:hypothetical protein [Deltaproteobacteria bacterium]
MWIVELCPEMNPRYEVRFVRPGPGEDRLVEREFQYDAGPLFGPRKVFAIRKDAP